MNVTNNIGVVILAAGSSNRLGRPKQLLEFQNKTLLQRTVDIVTPFKFNPTLLVLGAHAGQIEDYTNLDNVNVVYNENWTEGIGSSIRFGVQESIKLNGSLDNILFLLSDQPYISTQLIDALIEKQRKRNKPIIACSYKQSIGVPVIFNKTFFPQLMELTGDVGAKKIILQHKKDVDKVTFKKGYVDIDTAEDYEQLKDNVS